MGPLNLIRKTYCWIVFSVCRKIHKTSILFLYVDMLLLLLLRWFPSYNALCNMGNAKAACTIRGCCCCVKQRYCHQHQSLNTYISTYISNNNNIAQHKIEINMSTLNLIGFSYSFFYYYYYLLFSFPHSV